MNILRYYDPEWGNYVKPFTGVATLAVDFPPLDVNVFHNLIKRASKRYDLVVPMKENNIFLYDFKGPAEKTVKSHTNHWPYLVHGLKVMKTPATVVEVIPRFNKKYKVSEETPLYLICYPRSDPR